MQWRLWFLGTAMLGVACADAPVPGTVFDDPLPAPALAFAQADGTPFALTAERGRVVALFFGYTHCPDVCPTVLSDWARARTALGSRAERVRWVFVSVDPQRDTPAIAAAYARQFDSTFVGLTGSAAALDSLKQAWGIAAWAQGDTTGTAYLVAHPAQTFVVDREGRVRMVLDPQATGDELARALRQLL